MFRLIAEARINNTVALQRQPYLGFESLGLGRLPCKGNPTKALGVSVEFEAASGHAALPNFQLPQTNSTGFVIRGSKLW